MNVRLSFVALVAVLLHAPLAQNALAQDDLAQDDLAQDDLAQDVAGEDSAESATPNDANDARARELYEQGAAAYEAGHYDAALGFFEESHALSGRATLLFNIATSADRLRENEKALENYEAYLAELPEASNAPEVTTRIRVLREEVTQQRRLEASLANLEAEADEDRVARRRRRIIGGVAGAVLLVGGAILLGVLVGGERFDDYDSHVIQTLRSPL